MFAFTAALRAKESIYIKSCHSNVFFSCLSLGYTSSAVEVTTISQAQFTPLAEALHRVVDELSHSLQNESSAGITFEAIVRQLKTEFPCMELPPDELLRGSLSGLVAEHKLAYDAARGLYTATRPLLTPWDEFEHLTLLTHSDQATSHSNGNFKVGPDDEIDNELTSANGVIESAVNRCATSTTVEAPPEYHFHHHHRLKSSGANSSKSNTLSSVEGTQSTSSSDATSLEKYLQENATDGKGHRRNSASLSNGESEQAHNTYSSSNLLELNRGRGAVFKRSKSLRISSSNKVGPKEQQQQLPKDCTCSSEIIIKSM